MLRTNLPPSRRMIYPPAKESYDYLLYHYIHKKSITGGKRHGGILGSSGAGGLSFDLKSDNSDNSSIIRI
jgi:hypothetical protein